ncbi:MAG TPA: hypothetical protein VF763_11960 [Candidatus Limnocylindrales bacterium]
MTGRPDAEVPGRYWEAIGNGKGTVALTLAPADPSAAAGRYALWRAGKVGPIAEGSPIGWSADGTALVVAHPFRDPARGPGAERAIWLEIVHPSEASRIELGGTITEAGIDPQFSPDGRQLAVCALQPTGECSPSIVRLEDEKATTLGSAADTSMAWINDGELAFTHEGRLLLASATGTVTDGGLEAGWVLQTGSGSVIVGSPQSPALAILTRGIRVRLELPGPLAFGPVASSDGRSLAAAYSESGGPRQRLVLITGLP